MKGRTELRDYDVARGGTFVLPRHIERGPKSTGTCSAEKQRQRVVSAHVHVFVALRADDKGGRRNHDVQNAYTHNEPRPT